MKSRYLLFGILVLAFVLRVVNLSVPDMFTDEAAYAFRAIGNIDYVEAEDQTTPLEWFDTQRTQQSESIPWWTALSFHDHPPLFFWTLHTSIKVFGEHPFAVRFPSVLFGVLSVYAIYAIGKKLGGEQLGFFAALLLAVTTNHLFISRIGLQESMLIALGLMGILSVMKTDAHKQQYYIAAFWFGLAFLTKYNAVLFMAIGALVLLTRGVRVLPWKTIILSAVIFLVIIAPVIIYNVMLYRTVGHFDFQFSYIFGQHPDVWKVTPGKDIGSVWFRLTSFGPNVLGTNSPLLLLLAGVGFVGMLLRKDSTKTKLALAGSAVIVVAYNILLIGVSYRFLTMLTPFLALLAAFALMLLYERVPKNVGRGIFLCIAVIEIAYGLNSIARAIPYGTPVLTYAEQAHSELLTTGYGELARALNKDLEGFRPSQVFEMKYDFLTNIHKQEIDAQIAAELKPKSLIIAYDPNVHNLAQLWYFDRLNIFHAWPVLNIDQYATYAAQTQQTFPDTNYNEHIFVICAPAAMTRHFASLNNTGAQTETALRARGLKPEIIYAPNGEEAFHIYRFTSAS